MSPAPPYKQRMRAYSDELRVRKNEDGIYLIMGRYATVEPYDEEGEYLLVACDFPSRRLMNARLAKAAAIAPGYQVTQEGDRDACFIIRNADVRGTLERLRPILGLYVRKHYPDRKLAGAALKAASKRHIEGGGSRAN